MPCLIKDAWDEHNFIKTQYSFHRKSHDRNSTLLSLGGGLAIPCMKYLLGNDTVEGSCAWVLQVQYTDRVGFLVHE